jgi:hypothetical protein
MSLAPIPEESLIVLRGVLDEPKSIVCNRL